MLANYGRVSGARSGREDAEEGRAKRPRPTFSFAIISPRYLENFLDAYRQAYADQERTQREAERRRLLDEVKAKTPTPGQLEGSEADVAFEAGWKAGISGQIGQVPRDFQEHTEAWLRGHSIGQRDRDYRRARELRQSLSKDEVEKNRQGGLER